MLNQKGIMKIKESIFKNHKIVIAFNNNTEEYFGYVVMNNDDDIHKIKATEETNHFIDEFNTEIIGFKSKDIRCNNFTYYENACMDIVAQLTMPIN